MRLNDEQQVAGLRRRQARGRPATRSPPGRRPASRCVDRADGQLQDAVGAADERHEAGPRSEPAVHRHDRPRTPSPQRAGRPRKTASIAKRMNIMWIPFESGSHSPAPVRATAAHKPHELAPQRRRDLDARGQLAERVAITSDRHRAATDSGQSLRGFEPTRPGSGRSG